MIFKQIEEIINGSKTQTRRVVKSGEDDVLQWNPEIDAYCNHEQGRMMAHLPADIAEKIPVSYVTDAKGRIKWYVGHTYAVVPKRGAMSVYVPSTDSEQVFGKVFMPDREWVIKQFCDPVPSSEVASFLARYGYKPLRIEITAIRREQLQGITEQDAIAEGLTFKDGYYGYQTGDITSHGYADPIDAYFSLWESINGKTKGARWADNPDVWVIEFRVAR